jgi:hypothetical protein
MRTADHSGIARLAGATTMLIPGRMDKRRTRSMGGPLTAELPKRGSNNPSGLSRCSYTTRSRNGSVTNQPCPLKIGQPYGARRTEGLRGLFATESIRAKDGRIVNSYFPPGSVFTSVKRAKDTRGASHFTVRLPSNPTTVLHAEAAKQGPEPVVAMFANLAQTPRQANATLKFTATSASLTVTKDIKKGEQILVLKYGSNRNCAGDRNTIALATTAAETQAFIDAEVAKKHAACVHCATELSGLRFAALRTHHLNCRNARAHLVASHNADNSERQ